VKEKGKDQGKPLKFGSWQERCEACVMLGGEQAPCCTEMKLRLILEETKGERECPRIDLHPENVEALMLANMAIGESPFAAATLAAITAGWSAEDSLELILLVEGVRSDRQVQDALEVQRKRAAREHAEEEKRGSGHA
jgi:hypothetical protein